MNLKFSKKYISIASKIIRVIFLAILILYLTPFKTPDSTYGTFLLDLNFVFSCILGYSLIYIIISMISMKYHQYYDNIYILIIIGFVASALGINLILIGLKYNTYLNSIIIGLICFSVLDGILNFLSKK